MKTLFYGGPILTLSDPLYAEALLIDGDRIAAVGKEANLRPLADSCVNLKGATLMPGFIDAHSHITEYAIASLECNLDGITDFETLKATIQAYIAANHIADGQWVVARNYEHNLFPGGQKLTLEQLDSICPQHLLLIKHISCHMGLVNSTLLDAFGITAETPPPRGGRYVVEQGRLTGCVEESACTAIRMKVPLPPMEVLCAAHGRMQEHYASYGITTVQDGYLNDYMIDLYRRLLASDQLHLDLIAYAHLPHYERQKAAFSTLPASSRVRIGGIKQFLDGEISVQSGWLREPYLDTDAYCGYPMRTDDEVLQTMAYAATHQLQIIYHSTGDAANAQFIRCLETAEKTYPQLKDLRPTLIHALLMDKPMLDQAAQLGAVISFFGAQSYYWCDAYLRLLGPERTRKICPLRTALNCGTRFNLHQDSPLIEPDMLETVWCAATRVTREGVSLAEEAIPVLDALRAVTLHAAYQYFEEDRKGSLEPGKLADFILLSQDPLQTNPNDLRDIRVLATYKDGACIYQRP